MNRATRPMGIVPMLIVPARWGLCQMDVDSHTSLPPVSCHKPSAGRVSYCYRIYHGVGNESHLPIGHKFNVADDLDHLRITLNIGAVTLTYIPVRQVGVGQRVSAPILRLTQAEKRAKLLQGEVSGSTGRPFFRVYLLFEKPKQ